MYSLRSPKAGPLEIPRLCNCGDNELAQKSDSNRLCNQPVNPMLVHQFRPNEAIPNLSQPNLISNVVIMPCYVIVMLQDQFEPPKHLHS